ncbi:MAG TPA: hypothetical protein VM914_13670 [Pyrinomonadaceae bacterium]|jgi:hypothetical protein|nr:hypothetical protein [Pyrinomonadaceae bacterium]
MTKNVLTKAALGLVLALSASAPSALAKAAKKTKPSAEHVAAVRKCNDEYKGAQKSARSLKGKERTAALAKAKADRRQCMADAPK